METFVTKHGVKFIYSVDFRGDVSIGGDHMGVDIPMESLLEFVTHVIAPQFRELLEEVGEHDRIRDGM